MKNCEVNSFCEAMMRDQRIETPHGNNGNHHLNPPTVPSIPEPSTSVMILFGVLWVYLFTFKFNRKT